MAYDSILVSTGFPYSSSTRKTEIIYIDNGGLICKDFEEYPLQIQGAVGGNMGSVPVICGGSNGSTMVGTFNQCYRLRSGKWKPFANLVQRFVVMLVLVWVFLVSFRLPLAFS